MDSVTHKAAERSYKLQEAAQALLPSHRIGACGKWLKDETAGVQVRYNAERKRHSYGGLIKCGSVFVCHRCAAEEGEKDRKELRRAIEGWEALGGSVALVTYTIRHHRGDTLHHSRRVIKALRKALTSGAWAKANRGFIQAFANTQETTHGENGWHIHHHEVIFYMGEIDETEVKRRFSDKWIGEAERLGYKVPTRARGVEITRSSAYIAEYCAKLHKEPEEVWTAAEEISMAHRKVSKTKTGRTPFQILADYAQGDPASGQLFAEYAAEMHGAHRLQWSRGARALLGLPKSKRERDKLFAQDQDEQTTTVFRITLSDWRRVIRAQVRAYILYLCDIRGPIVAQYFISQLPDGGADGPGEIKYKEADLLPARLAREYNHGTGYRERRPWGEVVS